MRAAIPVSGVVLMAVALQSSAGPSAPSPAPPQPVNLLTATPTVVAVSSTVANPKIVPEHLVDGDLGTAWNSRTGDLQGAWIGVRVPADARVTAIRMTVGFTKIDPKLGDLFAMNPRIRTVRVLRNGARIAERALDPTVRALQDIPIDQPGGEYRIEVVDVMPGTRPSWREICVSEFEIWGTLAPGANARPARPVVRVGSFDPPPTIASDDCVKAMFPSAKGDSVTLENGPEVISHIETIVLSPRLAVCRVEHARERVESSQLQPGESASDRYRYRDTTIALAPVIRAPRLAAGDVMIPATNTEFLGIDFGSNPHPPGDVDQEQHTVATTVFPLTAAESALLVAVSKHQFGAMLNNTHTVSTLYRVSLENGFTEILSYEFSEGRDYETHVHDSERCHLVPPKRSAAIPPSLVVACESSSDPPVTSGGSATRTSSTVRYNWTGSRYVEQ